MKTLIITIALLLGLTVFAKEIPVIVEEKTIKAEAVNILPNSNIDIFLPFSADEKNTVKTGLNLTAEEDEVLTDVLNGQTINHTQINAFVSALNKIQKEKKMSSEEKKYILRGEAYDKVKYLSRKKIMENI